jgi:hypothetical protein
MTHAYARTHARTQADATRLDAPGRAKYSIGSARCSETTRDPLVLADTSQRLCECARTFGWGEHEVLMAFMRASGFEQRLVNGMENSRHVFVGAIPSAYDDSVG